MDFKITIAEFSEPDVKDLKNVAQNYLKKNDKEIIVLLNKVSNRVNYFIAINDSMQNTKADVLFKLIFDTHGIKGGGNALFAQGSGEPITKKMIESQITAFFSGS